MIDSNTTISEKRKKRPAWTRTLDVILRTAHVLATSALFGGAVYGIPLSRLFSWYYLTIATGCTLIASEVYHNRHWPYQGRGIMVFIHVGLLGLIRLRPDLLVPVLTAVLVFGMVGSHMTKNLRYWSFVHGRVVD
jgi:ABC-type transporter Mla maintaining outer membrane lipid asymmetry permease subunit MlaE